jgi:hypothetical protein
VTDGAVTPGKRWGYQYIVKVTVLLPRFGKTAQLVCVAPVGNGSTRSGLAEQYVCTAYTVSPADVTR